MSPAVYGAPNVWRVTTYRPGCRSHSGWATSRSVYFGGSYSWARPEGRSWAIKYYADTRP